jgi:wyosine [tRNA(Phe)-imidazoG37] synthetase (radical SAM superfamily)
MELMTQKRFKYIYGPVYSWRLGMSLGIDPVTTKAKICNMDCIYCQLGRTTEFYTDREVFVPVEAIMSEIHALPEIPTDYYTFSGRGEPTLAKNLGEMITSVRALRKGKIAVITNGALIGREDVRRDLLLADCVLAKMDAWDQASFAEVDAPADGIRLRDIVDGLKSFKRLFTGSLALQIMFIDQNNAHARELAQIARDINPDEIQINTPLRPSAVRPLGKEELTLIKACFDGLPAVSVYEAPRKIVEPLDARQTIRRHGNFRKMG